MTIKNHSIAHAEKQLYLTLLQLSQHYSVANEWLAKLPHWLTSIKDKTRYAHAPAYQSAIERLPIISNQHQREVKFNNHAITINLCWENSEYKQTLALLKQLMPWRKGPFQIGSQDKQIFIDTEWRSDFKWQRVIPHISDLTGRRVLDVGGGSGYHGWRMAGEGANMVIIIDPSCLFYHQFMAIRHFVGDADANDYGQLRVHYIPVGLEELPNNSQLFHTVFCMGVLYHRASPFEHLIQLKNQLTKGGELVLETLVIVGDETSVLVPKNRYAQMNNVYFLPSVSALTLWLEKAGFTDIRCVDVDITSIHEQRATEWMTFHSLSDFLNPHDMSKTIEGYPAPMRAVMVAKKP